MKGDISLSKQHPLLTVSALTTLLVWPLSADDLTLLRPVPSALFQRDRDDSGEVRLRGTYPAGTEPGKIEARFAGGEWQVVDAQPANGVFVGKLRVPVGQGALEARATANPNLKATVDPVAVGDLFVITGQSNADGRGTEHIKLSPNNPCLGVKYCNIAWSRGDDPSSLDEKYGSPWPMVLNALIPEQKIPVGFIQAAVGSTVVKQWRKGGSMYTRMLKMVEAATDGGMAIKAVLYYQGENDITHYNTLSVLGDYAQYKENLLAAATDFQNDFHAPFLVGQITNLGGERARNDGVRKAQQESWTEHPNIRRGAVVWDILPSDGVHYRDEANMRAFANRWTLAIRAALYSNKDCAPPRLTSMERLSPTSVKLTFDRALKIEKWDGAPGTKALGFRFTDGEAVLTDADVVSTEVRGQNAVVTLHRAVSESTTMDIGSGVDGQGQPVLRDAKNGMPVMMVYGAKLK